MQTSFDNRRRNYYIKKKFQRNFILKFCALVILGSIVSGLIIYVMSRATLTTTFENSRLTIKSTADFILPAVLLSSIIVIVSTCGAAIFITLFTSHKIAGPLYRMEKDVQEVTSGNLDMRFSLRQGDELKALAVSLDTMVLTLKNRIADIKNNVYELESSLGLAKSVMSGEAQDRLQRLRELVDRFKISK